MKETNKRFTLELVNPGPGVGLPSMRQARFPGRQHLTMSA